MKCFVKPIALVSAFVALSACESERGRDNPTRPRDGGTSDATVTADGGDAGGDDGGTEGCAIGATPLPVDILFVVDNSGSMSDEQEVLAASFGSFGDALRACTDFRIAVVTTDLSSMDGEMSGTAISTFAASSPYHLREHDVSACAPASIAHGCFRGPDPARRVLGAELSAAELAAGFADNVRVGSCGSGTEQGLLAMNAALGLTGPGSCNAGFLRPEARLVVIFVSDEQDTDQIPVDQHVIDLLARKSVSSVRVAAIVGSVGGAGADCAVPENPVCGQTVCNVPPPVGSHSACTTGGPSCPAGEFCDSNMQCENEALRYYTPEYCGWCSFYNAPDCCSARSGSRYVDFARAIESRVSQADPSLQMLNCRPGEARAAACVVESICQTDFSGALKRIADALILR